MRQTLRLKIAVAHAHLGKFDQVAVILAQIEPKMRTTIEPGDFTDLGLRGHILDVKLTMVRRLMKTGKLDQAQTQLDQIRSALPDLSTMDLHQRLPDARDAGMLVNLTPCSNANSKQSKPCDGSCTIFKTPTWGLT